MKANDKQISSGELFDYPIICPTSPKQMKLLEVGVKYAMQKNELWHSRLPVTSHSNMIRNAHKVFYGAEYMDNCFAVGMWTDPVAGNRMSKNEVWLELRRLAIAPNAPKYTATWIIAKMIKDIKIRFPDITMLISYQDVEVHTGTIYSAANWVKDKITKGTDWTTSKRIRNKTQTTADKVRWVYKIKEAK
jgi:hypothetical protein